MPDINIDPSDFKTLREFMSFAVDKIMKKHKCKDITQAYSICQNLWFKKNNRKNI